MRERVHVHVRQAEPHRLHDLLKGGPASSMFATISLKSIRRAPAATSKMPVDYHRVTDGGQDQVSRLTRIAQLVYQVGFAIADAERALERDNRGPRTGSTSCHMARRGTTGAELSTGRPEDPPQGHPGARMKYGRPRR